MRTAIVLAFECLPARCLGLYGADAVTPQFDRLAADSITFDGHFVESVGRGRATSLPAFSTVETHVIAEPGLVGRTEQGGFASIWEVPANDISDRSGFAGVVTSAVDTLTEWQNEPPQTSRLLYLRATGLPGDDVPMRLSDACDHSSQLDRLLQPLIDGMLSNDGPTGGEWLMLVTATTGRRFEEQDELPSEFQLPDDLRQLTESVVQVPLLVFQPRRLAGIRRSDLTQPGDIATALHNWFEAGTPGADAVTTETADEFNVVSREVAIIREESGLVGIRTDEYYLLARPVAIGATNRPDPDHADVSTFEDVRLFVKPDDLWDVNNVADQEPEVVYELLERIRTSSES